MDFKKLMRPHLRDVKPYIPGKPIEEFRREKNFEDEIHKLASNENPYPPVDEIRQAIIDEIDQLNRYPNSGSYYLCHELARKYGIESSQIFVGNGSNEIIDLLVRAFVSPNEEIVYPFPSFIIYPIVSQLAGARSVEIPLTDYRLDLEAMLGGVTRSTKVVFVCNPNNPTGTYISRTEVERFLERIGQDVLVIFDEAYFEYVTASDFPDSLALLRRYPNVIVLRTFSKIYSLSGCRVGYSISDEGIVTCLHKVRQPFNVNRIAQAAARAALKHADRIGERVRENTAQKEYLRTGLQELGFVVPLSQTNFLLVIPPRGNDHIIDGLMDRGIIVRGMKPFGLGEESFRVTVGTPQENEAFLQVLKSLL